jgi:hypothetical protein
VLDSIPAAAAAAGARAGTGAEAGAVDMMVEAEHEMDVGCGREEVPTNVQFMGGGGVVLGSEAAAAAGAGSRSAQEVDLDVEEQGKVCDVEDDDGSVTELEEDNLPDGLADHHMDDVKQTASRLVIDLTLY